MKRILLAVMLSTSASAHRLDEYLQAALFSIGKDRVELQLRLTPGVAVFPIVLVDIDTEAARTAYAEQVRRDLSLTIDNAPLRLTLASVRFAPIEEMKQGRGEIQLDFRAPIPPGGPRRHLVFQNHHRAPIAAYLVNSLVPAHPQIHITTQTRTNDQSEYQLDYFDTSVPAPWWSGARLLTATAALLLLARLSLARFH
jgi:hypothetical protein